MSNPNDPPLFLPANRFDTEAPPEKVLADDEDDSSNTPPQPPRTDSDMEVARVVGEINKQYHLRNAEQREIDWLSLTSRELQEMVEESESYSRIEYFDMNYFSEQAGRCWESRRQEDASPHSRKTVRLFNVKSAILEQAEKDRGQTADVGFLQKPNESTMSDASYALKHPLLHRRLERNASRREVFRRAAEERQAVMALPSIKTAGNDSSVASVQRDLFPMSKRRMTPSSSELATRADHRSPLANRLPTQSGDAAVHEAETPKDKSESPQPPGALVTVESALVVAEKPKSLAELLVEQRKGLVEVQRQDDEVYKPILKSFLEYTASVQRKLSDLGRINVKITSVDQTAEEAEAAHQGLLKDGPLVEGATIVRDPEE